MKIKILGSASQDLIDGYHFYEKQAAGIGSYFLENLYADIDTLAVTGGVHSIFFGKYHRLLAKRFPFAVYYQVKDETAIVYAILDCRRKPAWIRSKLSAS